MRRPSTPRWANRQASWISVSGEGSAPRNGSRKVSQWPGDKQCEGVADRRRVVTPRSSRPKAKSKATSTFIFWKTKSSWTSSREWPPPCNSAWKNTSSPKTPKWRMSPRLTGCGVCKGQTPPPSSNGGHGTLSIPEKPHALARIDDAALGEIYRGEPRQNPQRRLRSLCPQRSHAGQSRNNSSLRPKTRADVSAAGRPWKPRASKPASPASALIWTRQILRRRFWATGAISYTKGCYIGQEVISRVRTYGQPAKSLARTSPAG